MRVGLADDSDTRPTGVTEHDGLDRGRHEREPQELVATERSAQSTGVVAQLPDLGGGLVDEGEMALRSAYRHRTEQRIGST